MSDVEQHNNGRPVPFEVARDGPQLLRLEGELDVASADALRDALRRLATDRPATLDFTELTFIDSSGLNVISEHVRALEPDAPLVLTNVNGSIRRVFDICGLDQLPSLDIRNGE